MVHKHLQWRPVRQVCIIPLSSYLLSDRHRTMLPYNLDCKKDLKQNISVSQCLQYTYISTDLVNYKLRFQREYTVIEQITFQ